VIRDVKAVDAPVLVERLLKSYLAHRASAEETFLDFARRHDTAALKTMAETTA
jgi:ferredoxin-nitrite reductase